MWQGWQDSNPQPSVLETAVLPIGTTPLWNEGHYAKSLPKGKGLFGTNPADCSFFRQSHGIVGIQEFLWTTPIR